MRIRYLLALTLSVVAVPALAHDPLPAMEWCREGRAVPIGDFEFDGGTLKTFHQCRLSRRSDHGSSSVCALLPIPVRPVTDDRVCEPNMCGEFDDDYHVAKIAAFNYCNSLDAVAPDPDSYPPGTTGTYNHQIVPLFAPEPASFHAANHHLIYKLEDGIKGSCMRCLRAERNNPTQ
jgi:hypothetical protein